MTAQELEQVLIAVLNAKQSPDWTVVIGLVITVLALGIAFQQLKSMTKQITEAKEIMIKDHERTRRERTVDAMKYYQQGTKPAHNKIIQLLDNMSTEELTKLRDGTPIHLNGVQKEIACNILIDKFPLSYDKYCSTDTRKNKVEAITYAETMHLRFIALDIINHYEACLISWHLGIVDMSTFEDQFKTLVDIRNGKYKLSGFRAIVGDEKFPATISFKEKVCPQTLPTAPKETLGAL